MNKEKQQIEEMGKLCPFYEQGKCNLLEDEATECNFDCDMCDFATNLYNVNYRKQSEGEWLPSPDGIQPIRCSKCNMPAPFVAGENEFGDFEICRYPSRYCHECGAKMKCGADEGERR